MFLENRPLPGYSFSVLLLLPPESVLPASLLVLGFLDLILLPAFLPLLLSQRILVPLVSFVWPPPFRLQFIEVRPSSGWLICYQDICQVVAEITIVAL